MAGLTEKQAGALRPGGRAGFVTARCPWVAHDCPMADPERCASPAQGEPCIPVAALRASEVAAEVAGTLVRLLSPSTFPDLGSEGPDVAEIEELTVRQREVLRELLSGNRVDGIARDLHISVHTVRNHLNAIFAKTGTRSQLELVQKYRSIRPLV